MDRSRPGVRRQDRPLTDRERQLVEWLISNGVAEAREYEPQLAQLRVVSTCDCGCPTVDFAVGDFVTDLTKPSQILADFLATSPEGFQVGVILHAREGRLSELEVYSIDGCDSFGLPDISTLRAY